MATNPDGTGLLDKLKRREYVMSNETSFASEKAEGENRWFCPTEASKPNERYYGST